MNNTVLSFTQLREQRTKNLADVFPETVDRQFAVDIFSQSTKITGKVLALQKIEDKAINTLLPSPESVRNKIAASHQRSEWLNKERGDAALADMIKLTLDYHRQMKEINCQLKYADTQELASKAKIFLPVKVGESLEASDELTSLLPEA